MAKQLIQYVVLGAGIGLAGYSAARPIEAATQGDRLTVWLSQSGLLFGIGIALIIIAAVLMRRQAAAQAATQTQSESQSPEALLAALIEGADLVAEALSSDTPDQDAVCARIDALRDGPVQGLVDTKDTMVAQHGMLAYAEFISLVSAAERNLNRSWSTLVDGYPKEAREAALKAQALLAQTALPSSD